MNSNRQNPTSVGFDEGVQKMNQKISRADKSKMALKTAFLDLFQTKEPEKITVVELCQKAGVNRSTFYAHYEYMDNLIRDVLWESVAEVVGQMTLWNLPLEDGGVAKDAISSYLHRFLNNSTVRRFCICANSGKYRTLIILAHVDLAIGTIRDPIKYYTVFYHYAGSLNFILEWIINGTMLPEETVVEIIHEFSKVMYYQSPLIGSQS